MRAAARQGVIAAGTALVAAAMWPRGVAAGLEALAPLGWFIPLVASTCSAAVLFGFAAAQRVSRLRAPSAPMAALFLMSSAAWMGLGVLHDGAFRSTAPDWSGPLTSALFLASALGYYFTIEGGEGPSAGMPVLEPAFSS